MLIQNKFRVYVWFTSILFLLMLFILDTSCKKYLEAKPDQKLTVPETLQDLELLITNYDVLNSRYRPVAEVAADNYYLTDIAFGSTSEAHRNYYTWQPYDDIGADWNIFFNNILYTNIILEALDNIEYEITEKQRWNDIKGSALFFRAFNYYELVQLFAPAYDESLSNQELGIPLRLSSNLNEPSKRSTVKETYNRILSDLNESLHLLPDIAQLKYKPSKAASYGLLARTYLVMQKYDQAGLYADSVLRLQNALMDYNSSSFVNINHTTIPIQRWNPEVVLDAMTASPSALARTRAKIDTLLFQSYNINDLRRTAFFRVNSDGSYHFKGNYTGSSSAALFCGIGTDEMYLIRAECYARAGNKDGALNDLNTLIVKRWKNNATWTPFTAVDADVALTIILGERRKELLFRNLRWSDLRRLNKETRFQVTPIRKLNGQTYQLPPGSPRWVFLIDRDAINISGMQQNP